MSADEDDRIVSEDEDGLIAPVFVLPGAGATTAQGIGGGAGTATGSPLIPQPVAPDFGTSRGSDSLADRVEQTLAEDGRFSGLLTALAVTADDNSGQVTLTGTLDDPDLRPSLIATLHAVPGVTAVNDQTQA